ncbi:MAG: hypothetical protein COC05_01395 [Gammaproteobacteria bacterium]|nr:MAG: hypothetical protein COC05_01395 [Gammaproteobacteria bacterium]
MSHTNNVQQPSQLADKDTALSDYFDMLLHETTIAEKPALVSECEESHDEPELIIAGIKKTKIVIEKEGSALDITASSEDFHCGSLVAVTPSNNIQNVTDLAPITELESEPLVDALSDTDEAGAVEPISVLQVADADLESSSNSCSGDEASEPEEENYYVEGAPEWAHGPFQGLEFTIAKLKLVIPLIHLCGILDWENAELTPMPGHSKLFIGIWPNHGTSSKIVDVAEMLVPKRYHNKIEAWQSRTTKIVLIDDSVWGLACDEVLGVVTLDPREVRWRSNLTQRAWLAGTLVGHMSALIDGDELAARLLHGDKNEEFIASCA